MIETNFNDYEDDDDENLLPGSANDLNGGLTLNQPLQLH